jgi:hypothetical protein
VDPATRVLVVVLVSLAVLFVPIMAVWVVWGVLLALGLDPAIGFYLAFLGVYAGVIWGMVHIGWW